MIPAEITITFVKMAAVLLFLSGMMVAALYVIRRLGVKSGGPPDLSIRVLSSRYIGVKKYISLVEVPGAILVIGVTRDQIRLLSKIENPDILDRFKKPGASPPVFSSPSGELASIKKKPGPERSDETP